MQVEEHALEHHPEALNHVLPDPRRVMLLEAGVGLLRGLEHWRRRLRSTLCSDVGRAVRLGVALPDSIDSLEGRDRDVREGRGGE